MLQLVVSRKFQSSWISVNYGYAAVWAIRNLQVRNFFAQYSSAPCDKKRHSKPCLIPRPSRHCFCILQAVKYWSQEWPGNEATLQPSLSYLVWERDQFPLQASHAEVKRSWYEATLHTHTYMYIHGLLWVYPWPSQAVPCQQWLWHRPHPTSESSPHGHSDNPEGSIYTPFKVCGGEC